MDLYHIDALPYSLPSANRVVALGLFDGVHIGHRAVITAAADQLGRFDDARLSVFTIKGLKKGPRLCDDVTQRTLLTETGADEWLQTDFAAVRDLSPERFVTAFLRDTLGAVAVVCGFNFHFGKGGTGDAKTLCALCEKHGIRVTVVPPVCDDGDEPVSSSRIRGMLEQGDMLGASRLLGYPFTLRFPVAHGQHLGHSLGFPTINQPLPTDYIRPRFGVYASAVIVDGRVTWGVTNIGTHPTVGDSAPVAETWIPAFEGDLYGQEVPVTPIRFLREERQFRSLDELKAQIEKDSAAARAAVCGTPTAARATDKECDTPVRAVFFDFDDTLQDRHAAFLSYANALMARYFPHLPQEERAARAHWLFTENNGGYTKAGDSLHYPRFFDMVSAHFETGALPDGATLLRNYLREFPQNTTLFDDACDTLRALRERGVILGVITNGNTVMQLRKLDHSGLRPLLDVTVVSGTHGIYKPQAELFLRAAAYAGVAPQDCVFVGDHPRNDIAGARGAGMRAVYMDAFEARAVSDVPRITALHELIPLLGLE